MARLAKRRDRPACKRLRIIRHWEPFLVHWGKTDPGELELHHSDPTTGICFACGFERELHMAHIKPRCRGGSDEVSNLHLLCPPCHQASEYLEGEEYFEWVRGMSMVARLWQMAAVSRPDQFARALLRR